MSATFRFSCPLPNGLHARPATHLADTVGRFKATVSLVNERTGRSANARSVLGLVGTDTRRGDPCRIDLAGADEAEAKDALEAYVVTELPKHDAPLVTEPIRVGTVVLPRSLVAAGLKDFVAGQPACVGVAIGAAVIVGRFVVPTDGVVPRRGDVAAEQGAFDDAVRAVRADLERMIGQGKGTEASVLKAHLAVLHDPTLHEAVTAAIAAGETAAIAVARVGGGQRDLLAAADSAYVRERALDVDDVTAQLWAKLAGVETRQTVPALTVPTIVFAEQLTPSQFLALDRNHLRGLVLAHGGQTSHVIILARSFGIPTLTGVSDALAIGRKARTAILDANLGLAVGNPTAPVLQHYERERAKLERMAATARSARTTLAVTADGTRLEVAANIASVEETEAAFAEGAEGIGLFRTELLFARQSKAPSEDEQAALYSAVVRAACGRPVIIRTLDVGGDKPVPFLTFPAEANPFLGYRGVRFYAEQAALIKDQLRAILRAAAMGPVKILVPMIATVEEARLVRRLLAEAEAELRSRNLAPAQPVPLGFMLEVPSTAFILDELCAEADFFSLGTNDLAQYFSAADRENTAVAALNHPLQPAFLRLLQHIVDRVHARGRWIGLCGELGENAAALPLLVGLGLDEISLARPRIAATKHALRFLDRALCRELLLRVAGASTRAEATARLAAAPAKPAPMLVSQLVLDRLEVGSKAEAIRVMVDALHEFGRTTDPVAVETAVWAREDAYSTGFGDGFALPHAKTDALTANSIVVARFARPIEWSSLDGKPVDVAILLAIRASDHGKTHLETLARLSRLAMRDEFRDGLRRETDAAGIVKLLIAATATGT